MNSPDLEYETTVASPSERSNYIEFQINQQLHVLREQVQNVNEKLEINLKILDEKQSENRQLKELLTKLEVSMNNIGITQINDSLVKPEAVCISCKKCQIY